MDNDENVDQYLRELYTAGIVSCHARPLHLEVSPAQYTYWESRVNASDLYQRFPPPTNDSSSGISKAKTTPVYTSPFLPHLVIDWLMKRDQLSTNDSLLLSSSGNYLKAALMHRLYPDELMFHSIFWPSTIVVCGLLFISLAYAIDGCKTWVTDMTVIA